MLSVLIGLTMLIGCGRNQEPAKTAETAPAGTPAAAAPAPPPAGGPHAFVHLKDGSKVPGSVVASSGTDIVLAGDDGIERKIPLSQVQSVEYAEAARKEPARQAAKQPAPSPSPAVTPETTASAPPPAQPPAQPPAAAPPPPPPVTTTTYELPAGSELSVRTNEAIDSATAAEGQSFEAQLTRDARDAQGAVVIPRRSRASIVIRSASKGGHFRGQSDLVLDLDSVIINGKRYAISTTDLAQKGKSGIGANKRTAEYTGGGAALGAIIGAIAGGGKGAAIGAGAGAGAGAIGQIVTKGGAVKVPAESVLTFSLDKPLSVTAEQ